jgi:uncharacterized protein YcbK (DUF882 family)
MNKMKPNQRYIKLPAFFAIFVIANYACAGEDRDSKMYEKWKEDKSKQVAAFEAFLEKEQLSNLIPLHMLLRDASDWRDCKSQGFDTPPPKHWESVKSTLLLVAELKNRGILKNFEVNSGYRNPKINECAGGAKYSAHMTHFALDITTTGQKQLADNLCQFWKSEGRLWRMGLSRYSSGRIHVDTKRYRTWGNSGKPSYCASK